MSLDVSSTAAKINENVSSFVIDKIFERIFKILGGCGTSRHFIPTWIEALTLNGVVVVDGGVDRDMGKIQERDIVVGGSKGVKNHDCIPDFLNYVLHYLKNSVWNLSGFFMSTFK
jgi:hypothetical protein